MIPWAGQHPAQHPHLRLHRVMSDAGASLFVRQLLFGNPGVVGDIECARDTVFGEVIGVAGERKCYVWNKETDCRTTDENEGTIVNKTIW